MKITLTKDEEQFKYHVVEVTRHRSGKNSLAIVHSTNDYDEAWNLTKHPVNAELHYAVFRTQNRKHRKPRYIHFTNPQEAVGRLPTSLTAN